MANASHMPSPTSAGREGEESDYLLNANLHYDLDLHEGWPKLWGLTLGKELSSSWARHPETSAFDSWESEDHKSEAT